MDRFKVAIVIPAFNEEKTICNVVQQAKTYGQPIVINDCSTDDTATIAQEAGAIVITHVNNMGYDSALNSGFKKAYECGYDIIITLDADGQHNPDLLKKFIEEIVAGSDLVLGVRDKRPRIAEHIFALYSSIRYGVNDPLCGLKAYKRSTYESLGYFDSYSSIGTELTIHSIKKGLTFSEIPFDVQERMDSPRFGRLIDANLKILRAMFFDFFKPKIS